MDRDIFMTPEEAKEFGLIGDVIHQRLKAIVTDGAGYEGQRKHDSRGMMFPGFKPSLARSRSESGKSNNVRWVSDAGELVKMVNSTSNYTVNDEKRKREVEKVENVYKPNLLGPNSFK